MASAPVPTFLPQLEDAFSRSLEVAEATLKERKAPVTWPVLFREVVGALAAQATAVADDHGQTASAAPSAPATLPVAVANATMGSTW